MVREEFPQARIDRSEISRGLIVQQLGGPIGRRADPISMDDDAAFSSPRVVEQTLAEFDDPRVGAVAIPYIEPTRPIAPWPAPSCDGIWVTGEFIGTAHAVRHDLFLQLGGY